MLSFYEKRKLISALFREKRKENILLEKKLGRISVVSVVSQKTDVVARVPAVFEFVQVE